MRTGERFVSSLVGEHQAENAAIAVTLLGHLDESGVLALPKDARRAAVETVAWAGRFDVRELSGATVVFDVAHNPNGAEALVRTVAARYAGRRVALVLGMLRDKAHEPFLRHIAPLTDDVTVVTPGSEERKLEAYELAALCARQGIAARVEPDAGRAVRDAARRAEIVVVTGSLFTVGDAMSRLGVSPADEPIFGEALPMEERG
jgi:dihydrofolate synthase/folylpolyglutamate synthase